MLHIAKNAVLTIIIFSFVVFKAQGAIINGINFPDGNISFADSVVNFSVGGDSSGLLNRTQDPLNALGIPDYEAAGTCDVNNNFECDYVTLGDGGSIILQFIDNVLTGSNNANFDLWIFEIGGDVEDTFVEVSNDGISWTSVGKVGGATSGIDIDSFGFNALSELYFVKLIDDPNEGQQSGAGPFVGADIDAVGAISTRFVPPATVNEPNLLALSLLLFVSLVITKIKRF